MIEFLQMGGHGIYIWPGYIISLGSLVAGYAASQKASTKLKAELKRFYEHTESGL